MEGGALYAKTKQRVIVCHCVAGPGPGPGSLSSSRLSKTMEPPLSSPTQAFRSRGREELVEIYITARFEY